MMHLQKKNPKPCSTCQSPTPFSVGGTARGWSFHSFFFLSNILKTRYDGLKVYNWDSTAHLYSLAHRLLGEALLHSDESLQKYFWKCFCLFSFLKTFPLSSCPSWLLGIPEFELNTAARGRRLKHTPVWVFSGCWRLCCRDHHKLCYGTMHICPRMDSKDAASLFLSNKDKYRRSRALGQRQQRRICPNHWLQTPGWPFSTKFHISV